MFQKVAELTPDSFRGYANMGAAYLAEGKYNEAIQPLKESLRIRATAANLHESRNSIFSSAALS